MSALDSETKPVLIPRSLEIYRFLGILDDYLCVSRPMPSMRSYSLPGGTEPMKTWKLIEHPAPTIDRPLVGESRNVLGQYRLEGLLRDHLMKHGVHVELSTELVTFTQDSHDVNVTLIKNGLEEQIRVAYVIGADGGRGSSWEPPSRVRRKKETDKYGPMLSLKAFLLSVTMRATGDHEGHFHVGIVGQNFDPMDLTDEKKFVNFIHENTERCDIDFKKFLSMTYWKPKMRMVNKLQSGRAFVVGDAAHIHSPTGGQGLNTSIQDSFNLAWKLALVYKGLASPDLLASFDIERLPVVAVMLATTTTLYGHAIAEETHRNSGDGQPTESSGSGFLKWRNASLLQLDINYRWSPMVLDARGNGGLDDVALKARAYVGYPGEPVHAGDRAPDAPGLVDAFGQNTQLHHVFKPTLHTFLIFLSATSGNAEETESIIQTVRTFPQGTFQIVLLGRNSVPQSRKGITTYKDANGHAFNTYDIEEGKVTVMAVRPDGYVGAFVYDVAGLRMYFSRIFLNV
ncbi:hypothetical protein BN946_scf184912.g44 [Trametes cinnabarina]|uniref:FAD-binding domain-containing protein n=1 Tax=Pycnoporus cinnabarinus TaxID=5643 RepID=A0A060ST26_PYCCI|nr:hypothetical protein BN946_scf184912.g44 [Trametes cinnabarina]